MNITHKTPRAVRVASMTMLACALCLECVPVAVAADTTVATQTQLAHTKAVISHEILPAQFNDTIWRKKIAQYAHTNRVEEVSIFSPAMNRKVPFVLIKAHDTNRPTVYVLQGAAGGEQDLNWITKTDMVDFYLKKNVNVVIPMRGAFSYYTDWVSDPASTTAFLHGSQKWETFLTKELPIVVESYLHASDKRSVIGVSMSATSALLFAEHNPGFYHGVGSFSGCAATSDPLSYEFVRLVVNRGGSQPEKMWGMQGSATNEHNDALLHANKLAGSHVYLSSATGVPGRLESVQRYLAEGQNITTALMSAGVAYTEGGVIEAAANMCTHQLHHKLRANNVSVTFNNRNVGVHTWDYWNKDVRDSWPVLARAMRI